MSYFPSETGELVFSRTYSRTKPDGTKETWPETVERVVDGNLALAGGKHLFPEERERLIALMTEFKILPAGRHLWASGVKGRQYLMNCWTSGWTANIAEHFEFSFLRLMEGGGVGANYSNKYLEQYPVIQNQYQVHIVCDPEHPDYEKMLEAGVLSSDYDSNWEGAFEIEDSREGWAAALVDLLSTYYRPAKNRNRVFDVSRVRPEGARLKTFGGRASGPAPLAVMLYEVAEIMNRESVVRGRLSGLGAMEIDHAIAKCVVSGGNRRSARMSIMHWQDPQIYEFLSAKSETGKHWTTNISVEVDEAFWGSQDTDAHAAHVLWEISMGMLANGEPGIWNSSLSNVGEPNPVTCTNPCGEIALEPWEPCNLGHVNLSAFVKKEGWNYRGLIEAHQLMTRFLIRATYGDVNDPKSREVLDRNRRIGVGHFGFASAIAKLGIRYSDAPFNPLVTDMLEEMAEWVDRAAEEYAHHLRIPVPVKKRTVAPTGTIAKMPGVSEGIHPIFAKFFIRRIRFSTVDPDQWATAMDYATRGYTVEPCQYAPNTMVIEIPTKESLMAEVEELFGIEEAERIVRSADELTLHEMLSVQAMYQTLWADNAVSYTANIDPGKYDSSDVEWELLNFSNALKGATIFAEQSMPQSPYERISREEFEAAEIKSINDSVSEECANNSCPIR